MFIPNPPVTIVRPTPLPSAGQFSNIPGPLLPPGITGTTMQPFPNPNEQNPLSPQSVSPSQVPQPPPVAPAFPQAQPQPQVLDVKTVLDALCQHYKTHAVYLVPFEARLHYGCQLLLEQTWAPSSAALATGTNFGPEETCPPTNSASASPSPSAIATLESVLLDHLAVLDRRNLGSMLPEQLEAASAVAEFRVAPEKTVQALVAALQWEATDVLPAAVDVLVREAHELLAAARTRPTLVSVSAHQLHAEWTRGRLEEWNKLALVALQCLKFRVDVAINELNAWHSERLARLNSTPFSSTRKQLILPEELAARLDAIARRAGDTLLFIETLCGAVRALKSDPTFVLIHPDACIIAFQRVATQQLSSAQLQVQYVQFDRKLVELAARLASRCLVMHAQPPQVVKRDKNFTIGARFLLAPYLAQCPNLRSLLLLEPVTQNSGYGMGAAQMEQRAFGVRVRIICEEEAKSQFNGHPNPSAAQNARSSTKPGKLPHFSRSKKERNRAEWALSAEGDVFAPFALDGSDGANGELLVIDVQHSRRGESGGKAPEDLQSFRWYILAEAVILAVGVGRVHMRALSPPMFLPVSSSQIERYSRITFWRNAFGNSREVLWEALGREISSLFAARTGRALQPEHLEFLRNKLLGGDGHVSSQSQQQLVTYERFSRDGNLRDMSGNLWGWLFKLLDLLDSRTCDKLLSYMWRAGHVHGFISKQDAHELLLALRDANLASVSSPSTMSLPSYSSDGRLLWTQHENAPMGLALVRFSESAPGAVSLCVLLPKGGRPRDCQPKHITPWDAGTLKQPQSFRRRLTEIATRCNLRLVPSGHSLTQILMERDHQTIPAAVEPIPQPQPPLLRNHSADTGLHSPTVSPTFSPASCPLSPGSTSESGQLAMSMSSRPAPPAALTYISGEELVEMASATSYYERPPPTFVPSAPFMQMANSATAAPPNAPSMSSNFPTALNPIDSASSNGAVVMNSFEERLMDWGMSDSASISSSSSESSFSQSHNGDFPGIEYGIGCGLVADETLSFSGSDWGFPMYDYDAVSLEPSEIPSLPADLIPSMQPAPTVKNNYFTNF